MIFLKQFRKMTGLVPMNFKPISKNTKKNQIKRKEGFKILTNIIIIKNRLKISPKRLKAILNKRKRRRKKK